MVAETWNRTILLSIAIENHFETLLIFGSLNRQIYELTNQLYEKFLNVHLSVKSSFKTMRPGK